MHIVYLSIIIAAILFGIVDFRRLLIEKRKKSNENVEYYNKHLYEKYGKNFNLIKFNNNNAIFETDDKIKFQVLKSSLGEYTDNLYKAVVGYKINKCILEKINSIDNSNTFINTRISCLNSVYFDINNSGKELLDLSNENKYITTILIGIYSKQDENHEQLDYIEKKLKELNIKNCEMEVLIVNSCDKEILKQFVEDYNMSDGDLEEYPGISVCHYHKKIR